MTLKTPISILQELLIARNQLLPTYIIDSVGNETEPKFSCTVRTPSVIAVGVAGNKKDAKQRAAESALLQLGYEVPTYNVKLSVNNKNQKTKSPSEVLPDDFIENQNYIGVLHEYASGRGMIYPEYHEPLFYKDGLFKFICKFHDMETVGYAPNKKLAKQVASFKMIQSLKTVDVRDGSQLPTKKSHLEYTELDMEILKKFAEMSLSVRDIHLLLPPNIDPNAEMEKKNFSIQEAEEELTKWNITYTLNEMQRNPHVMVFTLKDKQITLLGIGQNEEEATIGALNDALEVLREGCAFIS